MPAATKHVALERITFVLSFAPQLPVGRKPPKDEIIPHRHTDRSDTTTNKKIHTPLHRDATWCKVSPSVACVTCPVHEPTNSE